jgi:hypothetical protein
VAKKTYTDEERAAYKAGLAAAKKKTSRGSSAGRSKTRTDKRRTKPAKGKKRSKCEMVESYKLANGDVVNRPRIKGYRISKDTGYQKFTAFLGANEGIPKKEESRERFRNFVVNMVSGGHSTTENAVYDSKYRKLKFINLGLVANPFAPNGGYFGPGGARLRDKVTK